MHYRELKKNSFSTFFLITNNCQVKWARPSSEMDSDDNSGIFSVDSNRSPTTLQVGETNQHQTQLLVVPWKCILAILINSMLYCSNSEK